MTKFTYATARRGEAPNTFPANRLKCLPDCIYPLASFKYKLFVQLSKFSQNINITLFQVTDITSNVVDPRSHRKDIRPSDMTVPNRHLSPCSTLP